MNISEAFGKLKVWQERLAGYAAMLNFFMIFYLYILESPLGLRWYHWTIFIATGVVLIIYIDIKFIMPNSLKYGFEKNPELINLRNELKEIKSLLKDR